MRKATVKVMNSKAAATEPQVEGRISELMREVLVELGENPDREGLIRTPLRAEKALHLSDERLLGGPRARSSTARSSMSSTTKW